MAVTFFIYLLTGTLLLFAAILGCVEFGRRLGRSQGTAPTIIPSGFTDIESALFALLGLLIAFTFYGAASRFDARRLLVVDEANAIGTAYLRLQLLPVSDQPALKKHFQDYLRVRLATYRDWSDPAKLSQCISETAKLQNSIWTQSLQSLAKSADGSGRILLVNALNEMFDIANSRMMRIYLHPPVAVYLLMVLIALICSVLAGMGLANTQQKSWIYTLAFALVLACTVYVIWDMEYPRMGLIRIDSMDVALTNLEKSL